MHRDMISGIAHTWHPIGAPLSPDSVDSLLLRVPDPPVPARIVDLGCGRAEWLVRLLGLFPAAHGIGVDTSADALVHARERAEGAGVADRCELIERDAADLEVSLAGVVLCVGASHAFGGPEGALSALHERTAAGGVAVFGDGFWEKTPTAGALDALQMAEADLPDLSGLLAMAEAAGFEVRTGHISTASEWQDYEWSWTGALLEWASAAGDADPADRSSARTAALAHRQAWMEGYRGVLGFATLLLVRSPEQTA